MAAGFFNYSLKDGAGATVTLRGYDSTNGDGTGVCFTAPIVQSAAGTLLSDSAPMPVKGGNFVVSVAPTVTSGGYSAGDIVGGLIEPVIGRATSAYATVQSVAIQLKAAVTSSLTVIIFSADPSSTTKTDNAAYSLNAADAFKVRHVITGFTLTDHGTPNTYHVENLGLIVATDAAQKIQVLIIDGTGFTLTSTSDLQITFAGYQD